MARGMLRFSKNVTRSSRSLSEQPPVLTMTGLTQLASFSISTQSLPSELASLRICTPSSRHRSTDASSNGVAMVTHPALRMASTRTP